MPFAFVRHERLWERQRVGASAGMGELCSGISAIIPPRYYIEAMRKLMIMGVGIGEVWQEVVVLSFMTALLLVAALKNFNKRLAL